MQETTKEVMFLNDQGVRVTNTRFILPKQTFAMSGITSVQANEQKPSRLAPVVLLGGGVISIMTGSAGVFLGIPMIFAGAIWWGVQKTTYHVLLHTAAGESKALSSKDGAWISRVVHALNESIIHRG